MALSIASLPLFAQMSGTYTVDPGGSGDYTSINAAFTALETQGVNGPVTISIADGVYEEELVLDSVPGTNGTNTVTITSMAGDAAAVTIAPLASTSANGHMGILLNGADHISLTHLTMHPYVSGVGLRGHVDGTLIDHCVFLGDGTGNIALGLSSALFLTDIAITNCAFSQFNYAIHFPSGTGIGMLVRGNTITSNREHAVGIRFFGYDDITIEDNVIDQQATIPTTLVYSDGISVSSAVCPVRVARNHVSHGTGGNAITVTNCTGNPEAAVEMENNMVRLTASHPAGIPLLLSGNGPVRCLHNTVRGEVDNYALSLTFGTEAIVVGNIMSSASSKVVHYFQLGTLLSEGNLFHGTAATVVHTWDPATAWFTDLDLPSWQAWGYDRGSRDADPLFVSSTDLHITAASPAIGLAPNPALLDTDIDGDPRPDGAYDVVEAGADELDVCAAFSGHYTIGTDGYAQFGSFGQALNAVLQCGVNGPVVFEVAPGTYTENLLLDTEIPGASATNTITFRGQTADSTDVTLYWPPDLLVQLINLHGADHIAFEHMTFDRGNAQGTRMVHAVNNAGNPSQDIAFRNVRFKGLAVSGYNNVMVVSAGGSALASTSFERCAFLGGYEAISWAGAANEVLRVVDCAFEDWVLYGVQVTGMGTGLEITGDRFTNGSAQPGTALLLASANGAFIVERNEFNLSGAGSGYGTIIRLDDCVSPAGARGRVANNMLLAWDREGVVGLQINGQCRRIDILNNSISLKNTVPYGAALSIDASANGANCEISNNILNARTSYTVRNSGSVALGTLRRNLLYSTYASLAYWGSARSDLAALQAASGQFNNSIQAPPLFVSDSADLHIQATSPAVATGRVFNAVVNDFDLQTRPLPAGTNPDIGADEVDQSAAFAPKSAAVGPVQGGLHAYPNPVSDILMLATDDARVSTYRLIDLHGRLMRSGRLALPGTLDLSDVPTGTYLLRLDDMERPQRIVVQH